MPALVILDQDVSINLSEATLDAFDDPVDVAQVALGGENIVLGQLLRETLELRVVADTLQPRFNGFEAGARQRRLSITRALCSPGAFCLEGAAALWILRRPHARVQIALQFLRQRQA